MTLKELKQAVGSPKENIHYKVLRLAEDIFIRVRTENDAWITVLKSGHVIYQSGNRLTSFSVAACGDYTYNFSDGSKSVIKEETFDMYDWTIRVVLEGESRITRNMDDESKQHEFGMQDGDVSATKSKRDHLQEDIYVDPELTTEERVINEEELQHLREAVDSLSTRQKKFVSMYYLQGKSYQEIAKEWGCSEKAVRNVNYRVQEVLRWEWDNFSKNN